MHKVKREYSSFDFFQIMTRCVWFFCVSFPWQFFPLEAAILKKKPWYLEYGKRICGGKTVISIAKKIYLVEMRPKNEG